MSVPVVVHFLFVSVPAVVHFLFVSTNWCSLPLHECTLFTSSLSEHLPVLSFDYLHIRGLEIYIIYTVYLLYIYRVIFDPCFYCPSTFENDFTPSSIHLNSYRYSNESTVIKKMFWICKVLNWPTDNEGKKGENNTGSNISLYTDLTNTQCHLKTKFFKIQPK